MQNSGDSVFGTIPVGPEQASLVDEYFASRDFSPHTRKALLHDLRKFAGWFAGANHEPFTVGRVTLRDVTDFRDHLHREKQQAPATINRALVSLRGFFEWLATNGHIKATQRRA